MGTYNIPRNLRGETRIFNFFSVKSLISTAIGTGIGLLFLLIFSLIGLKVVGIIITVLFALIGYAMGAFKIPTIAGLPFTKNVGGEPMYEIIKRYIKFLRNRKIYTYTKEEK